MNKNFKKKKNPSVTLGEASRNLEANFALWVESCSLKIYVEVLTPKTCAHDLI